MITISDLCEQCLNKSNCDDNCSALIALRNICREQDTESKKQLIEQYSREIDYIKIELAPDLEELANRLIQNLPELSVCKNFQIRISYLRSYEQKKSKGRLTHAECRKIEAPFTAYLPYDFVITFYEPAAACLNENQMKILMLHELRHIGVNPKGLTLLPHDIEDFSDIISRYGMEWSSSGQDVPDILNPNMVSDNS